MNFLSLCFGIFAVASGIPMLLTPGAVKKKTLAKWKSRLNELRSGADERYFEERRSLETYRPAVSSELVMRAIGAVSVVFGATLIAVATFR